MISGTVQQLLVTLCLGAATAAAGASALEEAGYGLREPGSLHAVSPGCMPELPAAGADLASGSVPAVAFAFLAGVACTALMMALGGALLLWRLQQRSGSSFRSSSHAAQAPQQQQQQQQQQTHDSCASVAQPAASSSTGAAATLAELEVFAAAPTPTWEDVVVPRASVVLCRNSDGSLAKLGKGASGEVFRAVLYGTTPCACKLFDFKAGAEEQHWFLQEASMLWGLSRHPNIVQFLGVAVAEGQGLILMELMRRGDLKSLLGDQLPDKRGRALGWYNRGRRVALQVATGMAFLHSQGVVHMDLKSENVMLTSDYTAKIGDVGYSKKMLKACVTSMGERLGTFFYCAPEVLLGQTVTEAADIYSFGILLWEIITGKEPRRGTLYPLTTPRDCPAEVAALQQRCICSDPALRPSAAEVVEVLRTALVTPAPTQQAPAMPPRPAAVTVAAAPAVPRVAAAVAGKKAAQALRSCVLARTPSDMVSPLQYAQQLMLAAGESAPADRKDGTSSPAPAPLPTMRSAFEGAPPPAPSGVLPDLPRVSSQWALASCGASSEACSSSMGCANLSNEGSHDWDAA